MAVEGAGVDEPGERELFEPRAPDVPAGAYVLDRRHQRRLRTELGRRRRILGTHLHTQLPEAWVQGGDGGLQAYVRLPRHIDEQALVRAARRRSVLLRGGRDYAVSPAAGPPALIIGYAKANCAALTRGLTEVGAAYREFA